MPLLNTLPVAARPLDASDMEMAIHAMLSGTETETDMRAFLLALSTRGETVDELVGATRAMRAHMLAIDAPDDAIDCCGTGGDGQHTLNISTASAFVIAACGVPVAKHGNRASSSKCGAADVLEVLGIPLDVPVQKLEYALAKTQFCFLMAPVHHAAMRHVADVRRNLGQRSIFNLLGPLANPARVKRQLTGVFAPQWIGPMSTTLQTLGCQAGWVLHGAGLDEITLSGSTDVQSWAKQSQQKTMQLTAIDFGLTPIDRHALKGGDAAFNGAALMDLLRGARGPYQDIVCANAAAALVMSGRAATLPEAANMAKAALEGQGALDVFNAYRAAIS